MHNFLTVDDAAQRLGVSQRRILQYIDAKYFPAVKFGRLAYMIREDHIEEFRPELQRRRAARGIVR
jgi:excisionase family DNA binding protein